MLQIQKSADSFAGAHYYYTVPTMRIRYSFPLLWQHSSYFGKVAIIANSLYLRCYGDPTQNIESA